MRVDLLYWIPVFIFMGLIFYLSSLQQADFGGVPPVVLGPEGIIAHTIEYLILGFLVYRALANSSYPLGKIFILALIISVLYGASDEVHQFFVPGRTASLSDLGADALGSFMGTFAYFKLFKVKRVETNLPI